MANYSHHDAIKDLVMPGLSPEHQKWLNNNYYHPDTNGVVGSAYDAAVSHPDVVAANNEHTNALEAAKSNPDDPGLRQALSLAGDKASEVMVSTLTKHVGAAIDSYISKAGEREAADKEARKTKEVAGVDSRFRKLPGGGYARLCEKCGGQGVIPQFRHNGGECYSCNGSGLSKDKKRYTDEDIAGIKQSVADRYDNPAPQSAPTREVPATPAPKARGFANKFPGNCVGCGTRVGTGEGVTSKGPGGWEVRCVGCHHG